ncbi:hypothetical protein F441_22255 [Phytophthora nicotianae CJ01A1]|uniref:ZSWIM1/3 RNaseH-like domain-containing protein n=1 Tax=Phytophthora nicotianae CJ01A1 TaxID=1317063 RepID=W2VPP3_PHYNI|nr:hypothetical protein F441_22255 [Phytophthora nicotianae CJ01A1]
MQAVGTKRSRIYDYLLEHDENVIQSDVDNPVRVYASSVSNADDNDATAREIAVFQAADPEIISTVSETPYGETGVLSLVSAHMRRDYSWFCELLLVDCSYKTNKFVCEICPGLIMGQSFQQTPIEANGDWHTERAIEHFKRSHPTRIHLLQVVVVDKDLNEIRVLESKFLESRILICHFHVIKYLKEMRTKPEFGKISMLVYWSTSRRTGTRATTAGYTTYVPSSLTSRITTGSFFRKLKDGVDGTMSMTMCMKALIAHDRRVPNEYKYRLSRVGRFVNSSHDEEMTTVLWFTTHYVTKQIEQQYATALAKAESYNYVDDSGGGDFVVVNGVFF